MTARRAALVAALNEAERLAEACREEAPDLTWEAEQAYDGIWSLDLGPSTHPNSDSYGAGEDSRMPREMALFIAANDPAHALRQIAHARDVLERHESAVMDTCLYLGEVCIGCGVGGEDAYPNTPNPDDCPEVASLATAWGIE